ncbi:MAG: hypothetical protein E2P02_02130 [Acidobacteria bacterium]|nr:MAG: hypothetical protein E2P02_02130 [Acidobacteriota bacterium]
MAQVTIYLPDALIEEARKQARGAERSLSSWVAELVRRETTAVEWPKSLVDLLTHGRGDLVEPDDPPPENIEAIT